MHFNLIIHDDEEHPVTDSAKKDVDTDYPEWTVTAKNGLFKHGKLYKKGTKIKLHPDTAASFIELKEVRK